MTIAIQGPELAGELENFRTLAAAIKPPPGAIPRLPGVDIYGLSIPFQGDLGGDHIVYIDFNRRYDLPRRIAEAEREGRSEVAANLERCQRRAGILLADVSGHRTTDALIAAMLHQAFLLGTYYELDRFGEITTKLFEHINQRFYQTTHVNKYLTMLYGEIGQEGRFRFISAGHQRPKIFSREFGRFVPLAEERLVSFPPVGMFPSDAEPDERVAPGRLGYKKRYRVNQIELLGAEDLLLLYTDGLSDHGGGGYFPAAVERLFAALPGRTAEELCAHLKADLLAFAPPVDDISFVILRKTTSDP